MTEEELESALVHHQEVIFAGFAAEQKLSVVNACQTLGAIGKSIIQFKISPLDGVHQNIRENIKFLYPTLTDL